jgi:hypothetical protein
MQAINDLPKLKPSLRDEEEMRWPFVRPVQALSKPEAAPAGRRRARQLQPLMITLPPYH